MLDLIQDYVRGEFVRHGHFVYDPHHEILWFMAWIVLATLVTGAILSLSTWLRERRRRAELANDSPEELQRRLDEAKLVLEPTERFSLRHCTSWHPIALALLSAMSAASLWLGWHMVVLPLAAAIAVSYLWHFHLRRSGVRRAAVYSLASWVAPFLVVVATIISFRPIELHPPAFERTVHPNIASYDTVFRMQAPDRPDIREPDQLTWMFHIHYGHWPYSTVYPRLNDLNPVVWTVVALWSLSALSAALALARSRRLPFNPVLVVALASPVALSHWFTNPWAIPLGAFTMVLLGHAMSRERRLRVGATQTLEGEHKDRNTNRWPDLRAVKKQFILWCAMIMLAVATAVVVPDSDGILSILDKPWVYDWKSLWYDRFEIASLWLPFLTLGAVGYKVLRRFASPAQILPLAATTVLSAVLFDALTSGNRWFNELSLSHLTWPPTFENGPYSVPRLMFPVVIGVPLLLSYVVAIVLLFATLWQGFRGTLANYGGLLCGLAWIPIVYWVFEVSLDFQLAWTVYKDDLLLANLTIAAIAMFALLYWGFGPGSIRTDPRQPRP